MKLRKWLLAVVVCAMAYPAYAEVKPSPLFGDHGVLQRDRDINVWGTAAPGEKVAVTLEGSGVKVEGSTAADDKGNWKVTLKAQKAATDLTLKIAGTNTVTFKDIALGDVWICSGQSNMEWKLSQLGKDGQGKKVADAATNKNIRLFDVANKTSLVPLTDLTVAGASGKWLECKPETVINFSAIGYFFGREIEKTQKVTVGLIASDWGGTICEAWTSKEGLAAEKPLQYMVDNLDNKLKEDPAKAKAAYDAALAKFKTDTEKYNEAFAKWKIAADEATKNKQPVPKAPTKPNPPAQPGQTGPNFPTVLYNAMIHPLLNYNIKGAIWYQGESNNGRAQEYRTLFPAMITDWRKKWGYDFPFFAVQLAPYWNGNSEAVQYAELRDAQYYATVKLKDVGLSVITDAGDEKDIHPQKKEPAGVRLAIAARAIAYGEKIEPIGPVYKEQKIEGDKVVLSFTHVDGGLTVKGEALNGFTVCGEDKVFHPAKATLQGDTVVVTSDKVAKPVAVRFGWVNFAKAELNLFSKNGLPAVPFRTDTFPPTTK